MLRSGHKETPGRTLALAEHRGRSADDAPDDVKPSRPSAKAAPSSSRSAGSSCAPCTPGVSSNQGQRPRRPPALTPPPVMESIREFLKDLPSYDKQNFTLFNTDNGIRTCSKRPSVYLPTTEFPSEQIIVTEKTNILLRYLHQQWEKKNSKKRDGNLDTSGLDECRPKKRLRLNSP